jgi:hypothetical protein
MAASDGSVHMLLEGLACVWVRPKGILLHSNRPKRVSALWVDMDLLISLLQGSILGKTVQPLQLNPACWLTCSTPSLYCSLYSLYWSLLGSPIHWPVSAIHCTASTDHCLAHLLIVQHLLLAVHPLLITAELTCSFPSLCWSLYSRGLQFYTFFGISIGIKRRMIDIGKKITFYFLQNVWKCKVFLHLHLKYEKSAIMTPNIFFLKNINMSIKNTQNFMLISNSLMPAFRNAPNKS